MDKILMQIILTVHFKVIFNVRFLIPYITVLYVFPFILDSPNYHLVIIICICDPFLVQSLLCTH